MSAHSFYIPVMGIGFTIDTPLKIAKYGISSVISLVDDTFIEQMRKFHCEQTGEPYEEISRKDDDHRARRITAYLDLLDTLVTRDFEALRNSPFEPDSEITHYFNMLPDSPLKKLYSQMLVMEDPGERSRMQDELRLMIISGTIDVNIMTKLDRDYYRKNEQLPSEYADAMSALRGFANSTVSSSMIFSAGLNPRLYTYIAQFDGFFPDENSNLKKKIVLKVSDYRSAEVQGKFLAKKGLWVSEYRIESGLNCGGHAFPSKGYLMGPILDEFKSKKGDLTDQLRGMLTKALSKRTPAGNAENLEARITVQGGIGTSGEDSFLHQYYEVDATGWGTPFLLVPEATNVDDYTLEKLSAAKTEKDVYLSPASPMLVPFWNLRSSPSEEMRRQRIKEGKPGSPCYKGHGAIFNTEFTDIPSCIASRSYVKRKLEALEQEDLTPEQRDWMRDDILAKSCICHDLSGGATLINEIDPKAHTAICCGPNIMNFSNIATLEEMVSHIYGRLSLLTNSDRPHMFIKELTLYIEFLKREFEKLSIGLQTAGPKYFTEYQENLLEGIEYYRKLAEEFVGEKKKRFLVELKVQTESLEEIFSRFMAKMAEGAA